MLKNILRNIFSRNKKNILQEKKTNGLELMTSGKNREAINEFEIYLKHNPYDVAVLNDIGVCYSNIGNNKEAYKNFELAFSLDSSYTPAVVNHAKFLIDQKNSSAGLLYLNQAYFLDPRFSHTKAVYAGLCLSALGDAEKAKKFQLQAWLANFDNLRLANCYLFYCAYSDADESELSAEHRFWEETIFDKKSSRNILQIKTKNKEKIKIGYLSPDFRNHSVRYFFRPLQENQNKEKFEIITYHDSPNFDNQTEIIKRNSNQFHSVFNLTDDELCDLIISHELDILVDLAGHTSNNRINIFRYNLSKLKISALGYPPTTGLTTMDAKLMDRHIITEDYKKYYSETPLVLQNSFWCFDPIEDDGAQISPTPPVMKNEYITFGCVGNIAKITNKILNCWKIILEKSPNSKLLLKSINFDDSLAEPELIKTLKNKGFPLERIIIKKAEGGKEYLESYNDIDIILDTFPFNGGTTTCFAVYMGVPVITIAGKSLISRMGLSVMNNINENNLVANDFHEYIEKSIKLSHDIKYINKFKKESRSRMKNTPLGNGKLFAKEFEYACIEMLHKKENKINKKFNEINILKREEITRRAYIALTYGQKHAAKRILHYCIKHHPNYAPAHILYANIISEQIDFESTIKYLTENYRLFLTDDDKTDALISIARNQIFLGCKNNLSITIENLKKLNPKNNFTKYQKLLYETLENNREIEQSDKIENKTTGRFLCLIPCDNESEYLRIKENILKTCIIPNGWIGDFETCKEKNKIEKYKSCFLNEKIDILILIQKNIEIISSYFFCDIIKSTLQNDVVGHAGANRWKSLDWISDSFENKSAGFIIKSDDHPNFFELMLLGNGKNSLQNNMAVLDGGVLSINKKVFQLTDWPEDLAGAETMAEQFWTHKIYLSGGKLAVHRGLGVFIKNEISLDRRYWDIVRMDIAKRMDFKPFDDFPTDFSFLSIPLEKIEKSLEIFQGYLN